MFFQFSSRSSRYYFSSSRNIPGHPAVSDNHLPAEPINPEDLKTSSASNPRSLRHLCNDYNQAAIALKNEQMQLQKHQDKEEALAVVEKNELFNQLEKNSNAVERDLRVNETATLAEEMAGRMNYVLEQRRKKGDVGATSIVSPGGRGLDDGVGGFSGF